jgi:hypothetical protein
MSYQADLMEESLDKSCEQVNYIFQKFEEQACIQRGRDTSKNKRNRSRSASSTRFNISSTALRRNKKRQTAENLAPEDDSMSSTESFSNSSDSEEEMEGLMLENVQEEEELNLTELEDADTDKDMTQQSNRENASTIVSGSPQGGGSRK